MCLLKPRSWKCGMDYELRVVVGTDQGRTLGSSFGPGLLSSSSTSKSASTVLVVRGKTPSLDSRLIHLDAGLVNSGYGDKAGVLTLP